MNISFDTTFQYNDAGLRTGAVTKITVSAAHDPDGDRLTYTWTASNGSITSSGRTATWKRVMLGGWPRAGTLRVKVRDGRGGSDTFTIDVD